MYSDVNVWKHFSETAEEYKFIYIYIYDLFVGFAWDGNSAGCVPVRVEMFLIDTVTGMCYTFYV